MVKVGTVESIWRYPIKGMAGEMLAAATLGPMGVVGDRTLAVQDVARREIQSCKFRPQLLQCRARFTDPDNVDGPIEIVFPDGECIPATDPRANARISTLVGHESQLQSLRPACDERFYRRYKADDHTWLEELKATFEREPGEPLPDLDHLPDNMRRYVSVLGSFFLVSPLHILSTASLTHLAAIADESDWNVERFRPNVVVQTLPLASGLVEQSWLGQGLQVGGARLKCTEPAPRCGAVAKKQQSLSQDARVLRTIVREADQNLGIYGDIVGSGLISVGDSVYIVNESEDSSFR